MGEDCQTSEQHASDEPMLTALRNLVHRAAGPCLFTMLEVGALPVEDHQEPFHKLLDVFPGSRIVAFEVDEDVCDDLNAVAKPGLKFYPVALGRTEETRKFYKTMHPMCSSLYPPNEKLLQCYFNMEVAMLDEVTSIDTMSLDTFLQRHEIGHVDFIKIDIQGAELDVFMGGRKALEQVVMIVSEVEFIPHYIGQPLYGDVARYLAEQGFMLHKFLGIGGRALKPIVVGGDRNNASQHIWSDAIFVRDIGCLFELPADRLLKLGVLSYIYHSPDLAFVCIDLAGQKLGKELGREFMEIASRTVPSVRSPKRRWGKLGRIFRRRRAESHPEAGSSSHFGK